MRRSVRSAALAGVLAAVAAAPAGADSAPSGVCLGDPSANGVPMAPGSTDDDYYLGKIKPISRTQGAQQVPEDVQ